VDDVRKAKQYQRVIDVDKSIQNASLSLLKAYERAAKVTYSTDRDRLLKLRRKLFEIREALGKSMEQRIGRGFQ